jgi:hypothetical protein
MHVCRRLEEGVSGRSQRRVLRPHTAPCLVCGRTREVLTFPHDHHRTGRMSASAPRPSAPALFVSSSPPPGFVAALLKGLDEHSLAA